MDPQKLGPRILLNGSGPITEAMGAAKILAWPYPHMLLPTEFTAAKARPVLTVGVLVCSDFCRH